MKQNKKEVMGHQNSYTTVELLAVSNFLPLEQLLFIMVCKVSSHVKLSIGSSVPDAHLGLFPSLSSRSDKCSPTPV